MPDIPIDTLLIIGLLIASFIGKFLQKKTEDTSSSKNKPGRSSSEGEKTQSLRDVLKEAWERANKPEVPQPEFTDPVPPTLPIEDEEPDPQNEEQFLNEEIFPKAVTLKKQEDFPANLSKYKSQATHFWIKRDIFSNRNSLQQGFVLKEILDKPKSLRSFSA